MSEQQNTERGYQIGGRAFTQRPLVWGQVKQLNTLIRELQLPSGGVTVPILIEALGEKVPTVVAVLLTEEGQSLKSKDVAALAEFLDFEITFEQTVQVVEDFFTINPITSVLEKFGTVLDHLNKKAKMITPASIESSQSSAEETSPSATK